MEPYHKPELINMKLHPELSEKWVQKLIADDPSIVGLGDLLLRAQERSHSGAGRLDLLLQDPDTGRRYEIELQLGATDETHIIRTIEYWDIERKRYPQYDHCAVLIAEDITTRFLNVMSLFNGTIPFIAIQMKAFRVNGHLTLVFTRVLDELNRGLVDEDEEEASAPADRAFWADRADNSTLELMDQVFALAKSLNPGLELKYNKPYVGIHRNGSAFNFISFVPKKKTLNVRLQLPRTDDIDKKIEESGLDALPYQDRWNIYRLRLSAGDVRTKSNEIAELVKLAYDFKNSGGG